MIVKICDFGYACHLQDGAYANAKCGSPAYAAPEVIKGEPYAHAVDIWSLGVVMFTLLTGKSPFFKEDINEMFDMICIGEYETELEAYNDLSFDCKHLLRHIFEID